MIHRLNAYRINHFLKIFLILWLACAIQPAHAQSQVINAGGGTTIDYSDGMELSLGHLGDFQMVINNTGQLYASGSRPPNMGYSSVTLRIDGAAGTRIYSRGSYNAQSDLTPVSQSGVTGSGTAGSPWQVITVLMPDMPVDAGVRITLTDQYVYPSFRLSRKIDITGLAAADTARLYWYFDTQTGGSDAGIGYLVPGSIVGTRHPFTLERLQFEYNPALGPLWNHYHSGQYNLPPAMIAGSGNLQDIITPTAVDAGLALQWDIPPGSTSFSAGSDLVYLPAGVFARETFTPDTIGLNATSTLKITLASVNTTETATSFTYLLPAGIAVAAPNNLTSNCTPGGGTISASGSTVTVTNLTLAAKPANENAYLCQISVDLIGTSPGTYFLDFNSPDASVGRAQSNLPGLTVTPVVYAEANFIPGSITAGGNSNLEITLFNRDTGSPQSGHRLIFDSYTPALIPTSPQQVTSTCSPTPSVTVNGSTVSLEQITLAPALSASQPSSCKITVRMSGSQPGNYPVYFSSDTGIGLPYAQLQILPHAIARPVFTPAFTRTGDKTRLLITLSNATPESANNLNFSVFLSDNGITPASPPNLTSTCNGGTLDLTPAALNITDITIPGNTAQPASCVIGFDVDTLVEGFRYAYISSPDSSVSSFNNAELYVFSTPPSGANLSSYLSANIIGTNQTTQVTVQITSFENVPLTDLAFAYDVDTSSLSIVPGSTQSTCPGSPTFTEDTYQQVTYRLTASNVSLNAAPANGRYDCTITFSVKGSAPGQFYIFGNPIQGNWSFLLYTTHPLTVASGFVNPPGPPGPGGATAIPSSSVWSLVAMFLGLLWIANRQRRFFIYRQ